MVWTSLKNSSGSLGCEFAWLFSQSDGMCRSVGIGDEGVAAIASGCVRLKVINLSYCESITDASLHSLASLRDLLQLELRACRQVTSKGLSYIAASCKNLRELDVKRCSFVADPGIHALALGCRNLRQVTPTFLTPKKTLSSKVDDCFLSHCEEFSFPPSSYGDDV